MNGAETILAEILGAVIVLAVLGCTAAAREWVSVPVSVRTVPRAKRQGRTAAEGNAAGGADVMIACRYCEEHRSDLPMCGQGTEGLE